MSHRNRRGTLRIGSIIWQFGSLKTINQHEKEYGSSSWLCVITAL